MTLINNTCSLSLAGAFLLCFVVLRIFLRCAVLLLVLVFLLHARAAEVLRVRTSTSLLSVEYK
jgi:hypothetical protein